MRRVYSRSCVVVLLALAGLAGPACSDGTGSDRRYLGLYHLESIDGRPAPADEQTSSSTPASFAFFANGTVERRYACGEMVTSAGTYVRTGTAIRLQFPESACTSLNWQPSATITPSDLVFPAINSGGFYAPELRYAR